MTPDYYATLGLSPTSEDVVIHAAYRALMRRYHPDGNASAVAAARASAINAAYAVLGDPGKRAEYDELRAAEPWPSVPLRRPFLPAPSGLFAAASLSVLIALVFLVIWLPPPIARPTERAALAPTRTAPAASEVPVLPRVGADEPAAAPAQPQRQVANPQLDQPLPDLPPEPVAPKARAAPRRPIQLKAAPLPPPPAPAPAASVQLADLDRQQALLFNQSWAHADAARRAQLQTSRGRFIARRDACRSTACSRAADLARMREVSEIMIGGGARSP